MFTLQVNHWSVMDSGFLHMWYEYMGVLKMSDVLAQVVYITV